MACMQNNRTLDGKKILLFDFDGVLVSSFHINFSINSSRGATITEDEYRQLFNGNIFSSLEKNRHKLAPINSEEFFNEYAPWLLKTGPVQGMPEVVATLGKLYPMAIVSSTIESPIEAYLKKFNLRGYFEEILGANNHKSKFQKIMGVLKSRNIAPEQALFITDTVGDIHESASAGVRSIAVTWGFQSEQDLLKANPATIVRTPAEIPKVIEKLLGNSV